MTTQKIELKLADMEEYIYSVIRSMEILYDAVHDLKEELEDD